MGASDDDSRRRRSVLVVGGAGGIGTGIVRRLLAEGNRVAVIDVSPGRCRTLADSLEAVEAPVVIEAGDAADPDFVGPFVRRLSDDGYPATALVHCAATKASRRALRAIGPEEWDQVIRNSMTSVFTSVKAVSRDLREVNHGRIVVISSIVAMHVGTGAVEDVAYSAAKSGLMGLVRSLARQLGRNNVTVNAVAPGLVATPLTNDILDAFSGSEVEVGWNRVCPMGRLCTPDDVAGVVSFLLSEDASFVTGSLIPIDGGYHC